MRDFVRWFFRNLLLRTSEREEIDGLWIVADNQTQLSKVRNALQLIKAHDPRRYARSIKDLEGVWVRLLTGPAGQFDYTNYFCELDERFVDRASSENIASAVIHEAAHARLWRRGVRYDEDIRQRVEAICVRQQQAFASRLPAPEVSADDFGHLLELPATHWSDRAFARKHLHGSIAALRHLNTPHWLIRLVLRRHRALKRRQRRSATSFAQTQQRAISALRGPAGDKPTS
ncbi:hypothetical protein [Methylopila sp. M107]|uniref:hypothetical protein n=1 Tax=Methylopila sp. M107 TaxID=1101190 RepID=UPI0012DFB4B7|nr:hypothetical protein [Methylopila sp. M107]